MQAASSSTPARQTGASSTGRPQIAAGPTSTPEAAAAAASREDEPGVEKETTRKFKLLLAITLAHLLAHDIGRKSSSPTLKHFDLPHPRPNPRRPTPKDFKSKVLDSTEPYLRANWNKPIPNAHAIADMIRQYGPGLTEGSDVTHGMLAICMSGGHELGGALESADMQAVKDALRSAFIEIVNSDSDLQVGPFRANVVATTATDPAAGVPMLRFDWSRESAPTVVSYEPPAAGAGSKSSETGESSTAINLDLGGFLVKVDLAEPITAETRRELVHKLEELSADDVLRALRAPASSEREGELDNLFANAAMPAPDAAASTAAANTVVCELDLGGFLVEVAIVAPGPDLVRAAHVDDKADANNPGLTAAGAHHVDAALATTATATNMHIDVAAAEDVHGEVGDQGSVSSVGLDAIAEVGGVEGSLDVARAGSSSRDMIPSLNVVKSVGITSTSSGTHHDDLDFLGIFGAATNAPHVSDNAAPDIESNAATSATTDEPTSAATSATTSVVISPSLSTPSASQPSAPNASAAPPTSTDTPALSQTSSQAHDSSATITSTAVNAPTLTQDEHLAAEHFDLPETDLEIDLSDLDDYIEPGSPTRSQGSDPTAASSLEVTVPAAEPDNLVDHDLSELDDENELVDLDNADEDAGDDTNNATSDDKSGSSGSDNQAEDGQVEEGEHDADANDSQDEESEYDAVAERAAAFSVDASEIVASYEYRLCGHEAAAVDLAYNCVWDGPSSPPSPSPASTQEGRLRPRTCCLAAFRRAIGHRAQHEIDQDWWQWRADWHTGIGQPAHAASCAWLAAQSVEVTGEFACLAQLAGKMFEAEQVDAPWFLEKVVRASQARVEAGAFDASVQYLEHAVLDCVVADVALVVLRERLGPEVERESVDDMLGMRVPGGGWRFPVELASCVGDLEEQYMEFEEALYAGNGSSGDEAAAE